MARESRRRKAAGGGPLRRLYRAMVPGAAAGGAIDQLAPGVGGFLGILAVLLVNQAFLGPLESGIVAASIGASAVLLFSLPHSPVSQPWPLLGGNVIAALIGVTCARYVPDPLAAAALAVGGAIAAMHLLRCVHPPGGATALIAVVGGPSILALGYFYVLVPILLNMLILLALALLINLPFPDRRYPAALAHRAGAAEQREASTPLPTHADIEFALRKLNHYVDISEEELIRIYALATQHLQEQQTTPVSIQPGRTYGNGAYGPEWGVREVLDIEQETGGVSFQIIAGPGRGCVEQCSQDEFARWARYEVVRRESTWQKADCAA